ncbi:unnamed protein product [Meloidogyne enterolobii]|uniref:Uncharacterized protein n=1 Tax=Meloidogyne enterolobii TaxID=390850 RepID=A0ACB0XM70_MELEN
MKSKTVSASTYFLKTFSLPNIFLHINSVNTNTFLKMNSDATDGSNIPSKFAFLLIKIPKFFSSPLTSLEVAKKVGLGNRFAFTLDCLPFSEDGPIVVLVIDFLQMAQDQRKIVLEFLKANGGELLDTPGYAIKFEDWYVLMDVQGKLRRTHPRAFYSEDGGIAINGEALTRSPTAKSVFIEFTTPKGFTTYEEPKFFEF